MQEPLEEKAIVTFISEKARYDGFFEEEETEKTGSDTWSMLTKHEPRTKVFFQAMDEYTNRVYTEKFDLRENTFQGVVYHRGSEMDLREVYGKMQ